MITSAELKQFIKCGDCPDINHKHCANVRHALISKRKKQATTDYEIIIIILSLVKRQNATIKRK